jgi:hypothetical protein
MSDAAARFETEIEAVLALVAQAFESKTPAPEIRTELEWILEPDASRFAVLARMLGLDRREAALLLTLIAQASEPAATEAALRARSGYPYVHEHAVRTAFGLSRLPVYTSVSALNRWQLVTAHEVGPGAPMALQLDLSVIEWLAGHPGLEPELQQRLSRLDGSADAARDLAAPLHAARKSGRPLVVDLEGADVAETAADLAAALGATIWAVAPREDALDPRQVLRLHRFVTVQNAALFWPSPDLDAVAPRLSPAARLQFVTDSDIDPAALPAAMLHHAVSLPAPPCDALHDRLRAKFPKAAQDDLRRTAAIRGVDARMIDASTAPDIGGLRAQALARSTRPLRAFATVLPTEASFDDLVVEAPLRERLASLVDQIRTQHRLTESPEVARVYAQERALTILLQGPPGTGKTLSARVLAGESGQPLFRVDVASLVSKWRGDTNKNLRAMFRAATRSGAILFVDEFDAVASRRTDARNEIARADNQNTAYFLQLIETSFEGTAIFATNRPGEIDEAMLRRIRHTIDVQAPGPAERVRLWRLALAPFEPGAEVLDFADHLGPAFDFSGARIKAVVLNAQADSSAHDTPTLDALRRAAMAEARLGGRLPGKRELARVIGYGNPDLPGPERREEAS